MPKAPPRAIPVYLSVLPTGPDQHEVHLTHDTRQVVADAAKHLDRPGPLEHELIDLKSKNLPKGAERLLRHIFSINELRLVINALVTIAYEMGRVAQRAEDRRRRL